MIPILLSLLGGGGGGGASYGSNLEVSDGYGAPSSGYGAPAASYGAPDAGYGAPAPSYDAPASGYDAPASGYDAPSSGYDAYRIKREVVLPRDARNLYDTIQNSYVYNSNLGGFVQQAPEAALHLQAKVNANSAGALLN